MPRAGPDTRLTIDPPPATNDPTELKRWAFTQMQRVANEVSRSMEGVCEVRHVAPDKPRAGDIRYADGTDWNPGGGAGFYGFTEAGTWTKLG